VILYGIIQLEAIVIHNRFADANDGDILISFPIIPLESAGLESRGSIGSLGAASYQSRMVLGYVDGAG
jgi:hypothetical protein